MRKPKQPHGGQRSNPAAPAECLSWEGGHRGPSSHPSTDLITETHDCPASPQNPKRVLFSASCVEVGEYTAGLREVVLSQAPSHRIHLPRKASTQASWGMTRSASPLISPRQISNVQEPHRGAGVSLTAGSPSGKERVPGAGAAWPVVLTTAPFSF